MVFFHGIAFRCDLDHSTAMRLVFLLMVIVDGETVSTNDMLFESVYRCNQFANAIERGEQGPNQRHYLYQENITAYCLPKTVNVNTKLYQ